MKTLQSFWIIWSLGKDSRIMKTCWLAFCSLLVTSTAWSQQIPDFEVQTTELMVEGWNGFTDFEFLINLLLTLTLAAVLGANISEHCLDFLVFRVPALSVLVAQELILAVVNDALLRWRDLSSEHTNQEERKA